jgi:hypothetical protein
MGTVFPTPIISNIQLVQTTLETAIQHHPKILLTPWVCSVSFKKKFIVRMLNKSSEVM